MEKLEILEEREGVFFVVDELDAVHESLYSCINGVYADHIIDLIGPILSVPPHQINGVQIFGKLEVDSRCFFQIVLEDREAVSGIHNLIHPLLARSLLGILQDASEEDAKCFSARLDDIFDDLALIPLLGEPGSAVPLLNIHDHVDVVLYPELEPIFFLCLFQESNHNVPGSPVLRVMDQRGEVPDVVSV